MGLENSSTSSRPPGLSTRSMERSALSLSVTLRRPKAMVMQLKLLSAEGRVYEVMYIALVVGCMCVWHENAVAVRECIWMLKYFVNRIEVSYVDTGFIVSHDEHVA